MRSKYLLLSVMAGAVCGVASYILKKKLSTVLTAAKAPQVFVPAEGSAAVSASARDAVYSFISGFKDASTVDFRFRYDPDRFRYSVTEDDFLVESGDSHVGILVGEEFSVQFEYASFYSGEDFERLSQELSSRHPDLDDAVYGALSGLQFRDGDNLCLVFPIPDDSHSYLLITLVKAPGNDGELEAIPDTPDFRAILNSASFSRT